MLPVATERGYALSGRTTVCAVALSLQKLSGLIA